MTDVLIVGAGPAGLAAAEVLARSGLRVMVAERQAAAGGMPLTCGHSPFGWREFRRVLSGPGYAARLIERACASGARLRLKTSVVAIAADGTVTLASDQGTEKIKPARILLATGAREASRAERLLPGERPLGALSTGSLQDLWFRHGTVPFRRPVILGSELVAMSAILTCRAAGAAPIALLEPTRDLIARAPFRWLPRALSLPVFAGITVTDLLAQGGRLHAVEFRDADGALQLIETDGLVLTGRFRPEAGLALMSGIDIDPSTQGPRVDSQGRTNRPGIFAAGNALRGVETAGWCWQEGQSVACAMIRDLEGPVPQGHPLSLGPGLSWIAPQSLGPDPALSVQLRAVRAARGRIVVRDAAGRAHLTFQVDAGPERRILLPAAPLVALGRPLVLSLEPE